jgi:hypothetical protein
MARVNLLNNFALDATLVTGNGTFRLWESEKIDSPNSENGLEVVIAYSNPTPDPENGGVNYKVSSILETQDNQGNWHPFHAQYEPFVKPEIHGGDTKHVIKIDPAIFNMDEGVINDIWDGFNIVARESRKQGILPDDFRIVLLLNENGHGGTKPFEGVNVTVSYLSYAV